MKSPNLLDVAHKLRADSRIDWPSVVRREAWDPSERVSASTYAALGLCPWNSVRNRGLLTVIAAAERRTGKPLDSLQTPEDVKLALGAFKSWAPDLLFSLWHKGRLECEHLRAVLLDVWRYAYRPVVWRSWRSLFRAAGFLSDGAPRPGGPITLYRGCMPGGHRGFSWTPYRWRAENFANHRFARGQAAAPGRVYTAKIMPLDILAIVSGHDGGPEDEVVVDIPVGLEPMLVETARQRRAREGREDG